LEPHSRRQALGCMGCFCTPCLYGRVMTHEDDPALSDYSWCNLPACTPLLLTHLPSPHNSLDSCLCTANSTFYSTLCGLSLLTAVSLASCNSFTVMRFATSTKSTVRSSVISVPHAAVAAWLWFKRRRRSYIDKNKRWYRNRVTSCGRICNTRYRCMESLTSSINQR